MLKKIVSFKQNYKLIELNQKFRYSKKIQSQANWEQKIPKKYHPYIKLGRFDKQIGTLLVFIPFTWGQVIALQDISILLMTQNITLFYLTSVSLRSAACAINDFWDVNFDKQVERTKERPLANNSISIKNAFLFCIFNTSVGLSCLYSFGLDTLLVSMLISPLVVCYPLAKRFTFFPQVVLGFTINYGIVIAYYATLQTINFQAIAPLYLASVCWTIIYDTIYAFQDQKDDQKVGVKSTALKFQDNTNQILSGINMVQLCALSMTGINLDYNLYIYLPLIFCSSYSLQQKLNKINLNDVKQCNQFFQFNKFYGLIIFFSLFIGNLTKFEKKPQANQNINF